VIEPLPELPPGVLGFRFSGRVQREEYDQVLAPALKAALERGERMRLAVVIDEGFDRFEAGAVWKDMQFGLGSGIANWSSWEKMALVSDADWVRHVMGFLGWMVPGEARVFPLAELEDAKVWLAA
jgi:hypothetical protein